MTMKYFKNKNNEIFAFESEKKAEADILRLSLTPLTQKELEELNKRYEPSPEEIELEELNEAIKEVEDDIRRAIIIGNNAVLESLRAEYKELIAERERLNITSESTTSEPITVAPTDHL